MENNLIEPKRRAEFGPIFARIYSFFASRSRRHREVYAKISQDIISLRPSSVLEIGSGPGIAAAMIAGKMPDVRIYCVDPSPTMVNIANRRFEKLSLASRLKSTVGDSSDIGMEGNFDVIFSSLSYHHWQRGEEDLVQLAEKHLARGTLIIYENLLPETNGVSKRGHGHGLSMKKIDAIQISGLVKTYEILGDLVALKFTGK